MTSTRQRESCRREPEVCSQGNIHDELGKLFSNIRVELSAAIAQFREHSAPAMMPVVDRLQTAAGLTDIGVVSLRRLKTSLPHVQLSDRELQVLRLIGGGRTVTEVSAELGLSVKTISTYRRRILEKLDLRTSAELIHYAVTNGLTT